MADQTFDFTGPGGQSYSISGPEGATREQAFQMLPNKYPELKGQPGFGGEAAAAPVPTGQSAAQTKTDTIPERHTPGQAVANVGAGAGVGAALGAVAPEGLMIGGALLSAIPGGQAAGGLMFTAGEAMRVTRAAGVLAGALAGGASTAAGEGVRAAGGSETAITGAELGAGLLTPGAQALKKFVSKPLQAAWAAVQNLSEGASVGASRTVAEGKKLLQSGFAGKMPEHDLHMILKVGAEADVKAADAHANSLMTEAYKKAEKLAMTDQKAADAAIAEAKAAGQKVKAEASARMAHLQKVTDGKMQTAERVLKQAAPERAKIGTEREVSDIGKQLQEKTAAVQGAAVKARQEQDAVLRGARDQAVAAKEQSGQFLDNEPGMKSLKDEIARKLLLTQKGREASTVVTPDMKVQGVAEVTEGGVASAYQKVYDAVSNKRVQTGTNAEGNPTYQTFKTTFEALDHVRRKLGDAAFKGADKEGYGALGQSISKDLYGKISKIQEDYAGPTQKALQGHYAQATGDMAKFETATGRKMTAVDRMDPEVFAKDPAAIPTTYFKSQQGVKDLLELTGDPVMVERAAKDYAAKELGGKSAQQVRDWAKGQTDWTREVPGLQKSVTAYADKLEKLERVEGKLSAGAAKLKAERASVRDAVPGQVEKIEAAGLKEASARTGSRVEEQQALRAGGEKAAQGVREAATAKAKAIVGDGFPAESVRKLLVSGSPEELATAARYIAGAPGGQKALEGSVRQALAGSSPAGLRGLWDGRLKVALREGQVLPPAVLQKLDADVQAAFAKTEPAKVRTVVQQLLAAAFATAPQSAMRRDAGVGVQSKEKLPWQ